MFVCSECGTTRPEDGACPIDRTALSPVDDPLLGTTINAFRVAGLLGIGGMGRVYKGVHPTIGSRVAIKVLSRECSDRRDLVDRFFAEARAVNLIRHEGIVNVLDLAVLPDGRPYIIMEYLDGQPLATVLEQAVADHRRLPIGGVVRLAAEVLDALGAAHAKHVVHRDLKPDNIFVAPSGRPKVLDFGIAKLSDFGNGAVTRTGSLLGTPHYMSPEQAEGRPVDARTDIYAMGVILFECLAGEKPFEAESLFELLRRHIHQPPPSLRARRPDVPIELEHVITTALAKRVDDRFANVTAMSVALQHATAQLAAEQWEVICPRDRAPSMPGRWTAGLPVSWGDATEPSRPRALADRQAAPTTVAAGQVIERRPARRGVWLALGAVALVGAAVAVTMLAQRSSAPDVAQEAGPPVVASSTGVPASPGSPGSGPGGVPTAVPIDAAVATAGSPANPSPAAEVPTKPSRPVITGDGARPARATRPTETDEAADAAEDAAEDQRMAAEEARLLREAAATSADVSRQIREGVAAELASSSTSAGKDPDKAKAEDDWFARHDVHPPGWKPARLDVDRHIEWAIGEARRNVADALLIRIDVDGVRSDGRADLTLPSLAYKYGSIDLRFISPTHANRRDSRMPRGARVERRCVFRIDGGPEGVEIRDLTGFDCDDKPIGRPRCTVAQIWKLVLAKHPDVHDAVASIGIWANFSGRPTWHFTIRDGSKSLVSESFSDTCK